MEQEIWRPGLQGVVVTETALSRVDGQRGELVLRGYTVQEAGAALCFEDLCNLLWTGQWQQEALYQARRQELGQARAVAWERLQSVRAVLEAQDVMEALRGAVAALPSRGDEADRALVVATVAVAGAAWTRRRAGLEPLAPDASLGHVQDYDRMIHGEASEARARALESYLVTVSDHGLNASTFAARVVASTRSDLVSAVVAAIGALKGPLHGGAPGPVLDMLDAIGQPEGARAWLEAELAQGRRIMGMGHRVYRVRDPRAAALEAAVEKLAAEQGGAGRLALARAVEAQAQALLERRYPQRSLRANVEFATAILLEALGLPRAFFTAAFCAGRVVGWCAHVAEQRAEDRLLRPRARYTGPEPSAA